MSAPTTRLVWSDALVIPTPACRHEHLVTRDTAKGWSRRRSWARLDDGAFIEIAIIEVDAHEWYVSVRAWGLCEIRLADLDDTRDKATNKEHKITITTRWPQARAAALLHLDALLASRLSLIARARR